MNNNNLLSICISSFNKSEKCVDLINKLIGLNDDRLNVVVCDDCSDAETWDMLQGISDSHFTLRRNSSNLGACPNWYETIDHGDGKYCLHILDRDYIDTGMIVSLLDFLENNEVGGGYLGTFFYNERPQRVNGEIEVYKGGQDSASKLGGLPFHPTGFFVKKDEWKKGDFRKFFYDEKKYGIYPHSYVMCFIAMNSDVALLSGPFHKCVFSNEGRSEFYTGKKMELWWDPPVVMNTSRKMVTELAGIFDNQDYRNNFILNCFKHGLVRATIRNRQETMDAGQMTHYGQKPRALSKHRLLWINFWFTVKYYLFQRRRSIGGISNLGNILNISGSNRKAIIKLAGTSKTNKTVLEDDFRKSQEFYSVMYKWLKLKNNGYSIKDYFEKHGFRRVAIYGMRELGELLYDELQGVECIRVECCIDRDMEGAYKGTPIVRPDEKYDADVIVVTAVHYYCGIESDLRKRVDCKVVSIEDVLYG